MVTMIVVIILMKIRSFVLSEHVLPIASVVLIIVVFLRRGIAMGTMTAVALKQTNQKNIVRVRNARVLEISLHVTMEIVFLAYTSAMVTMIVWTTLTRMRDISVTLVNAIPTESSLVQPIRIGVAPNVFLNDGFVMEILIVLMALMKIQLCTHVHHLSLVRLTSSDAIIIDVLIKNGFAVSLEFNSFLVYP